jgi:acetylornithine/succinyldiaminopimelate/putrescine aminotransferase
MGSRAEAVSIPLLLEGLLGPRGVEVMEAMRRGGRFLESQSRPQLLARLGKAVETVPAFTPIGKSALQDSFGGNQTGASDDFLVGRGLFYITEQRRLFLDCTSGHYQMLWGYNHPRLSRLIEEAGRAGIIWDNHSNIPQGPVKQLAHRLVEVANAPGETDRLDTVLLGVCTGSVACAAALKVQLKVFARRCGEGVAPVIVVLEGNYHGSDMVPQFMRGMWPNLAHPFEVVVLPPNDAEALEAAFKKHGSRIAGFWAEPVMMNREAIAVQPEYLKLAQRWCQDTGALLCIDEIQTGFWQPQVFEFRAMGLRPDLVVAGKGMTAGFHPLSAVLMKQRYDVLEQYDAISTNGSASMPALVGLGNLELIREHAAEIARTARHIDGAFQALAAEFPERLQAAHGRGFLAGLKFGRVAEAIAFQKGALEAGLWTRVHAYHEGHSTVLTKLGLLADTGLVDFVTDQFRALLRAK